MEGIASDEADDEADIIKKRKLSIIEEQDLAARRALPPIPDRLGKGATGEQIQQRQKLMAERARQLNKISKTSATAKRALEDDGHASHLKRVANAARPKGDARPAEEVAVKGALNAERRKGDDRLAEVVAFMRALGHINLVR